ncbi:MAG: hypothetical protein ABSA75_01935 [Candidatus Bathyarchaeia archaeon]|jgi:hypothetical protein
MKKILLKNFEPVALDKQTCNELERAKLAPDNASLKVIPNITKRPRRSTPQLRFYVPGPEVIETQMIYDHPTNHKK